MDNTFNNYAEISGIIVDSPQYSHENRNERFYIIPVSVQRLSGTTDRINVIVREKMITQEMNTGEQVHIFGQLRSFNNKTNVGAKLVISLFAKTILMEECEDRNDILLKGTICKQPNLRKTPLGREICDFMLAVNRKYNKSDYIPCISWGFKAREISKLDVGSSITITGRLQSRVYQKVIDNHTVQKTAYEVSVIEYE